MMLVVPVFLDDCKDIKIDQVRSDFLENLCNVESLLLDSNHYEIN